MKLIKIIILHMQNQNIYDIIYEAEFESYSKHTKEASETD